MGNQARRLAILAGALSALGIGKFWLIDGLSAKFAFNPSQVGLLGAGLGLIVGAAVLFYARRIGLGREDLGLGSGQLTLASLGWGLIVIVGPTVLFMMLWEAAKLAGWPLLMVEGPAALTSLTAEQLRRRIVLFLPFDTVLPEELAFRALLFGEARRCGGPKLALLISALSFIGWHLSLGASEASGDPGLFAQKVGGYAVGGVIFGLPRVAGAHLAGSMVAHWLADALLLLVGHPAGAWLSQALLPR